MTCDWENIQSSLHSLFISLSIWFSFFQFVFCFEWDFYAITIYIRIKSNETQTENILTNKLLKWHFVRAFIHSFDLENKAKHRNEKKRKSFQFKWNEKQMHITCIQLLIIFLTANHCWTKTYFTCLVSKWPSTQFFILQIKVISCLTYSS